MTMEAEASASARELRTLKLVIAYDGTAYCGWQRQANGPTIQAAIEAAFVRLVGESPTVTGAGRTDTGVHALGQVASVRITSDLGVDAIRRALNVRLAPDIRILSVENAVPDFHARFAAIGKTYRYRIVTGEIVCPFDRWYVWHLPVRLNLDAMRVAAAHLCGRHDFVVFQSAHSSVTETVRTITRLDMHPAVDGVSVEVHGDGFLRHMVRAIVGTLVDVGAGRRDPDAMPSLLRSRTRHQAGDTAPASGLTLVSVDYPPGVDSRDGTR
jgi:tRNA pseudouridine38-40 synthase